MASGHPLHSSRRPDSSVPVTNKTGCHGSHTNSEHGTSHQSITDTSKLLSGKGDGSSRLDTRSDQSNGELATSQTVQEDTLPRTKV